MKRLVFSSIFILSLLVFAQINVLASSCVCPTVGAVTLEQMLFRESENAKAVFSGTILEIKKKPQSRDDLMKIKIMESWKGISSEEITITADRHSSCGYQFEIGKSYLIFANGSDENNLLTGLCLRIREFEKATEELQILRKLKQTNTDDTLIALERRPDFFSVCPFYKLKISSDGKVEIEPKYFNFENKEYKEISGEIIKSQINQEQFKLLVSEFERINFYSLNSTFENPSKHSRDDCPEHWFDSATAVLSIAVNGKSKKVEHYLGCRGTAALVNLTQLENKIDVAVGIKQLLECDRRKQRTAAGIK